MHLATYLSTLGVSYDADLTALERDIGGGHLAFPVGRLGPATVWLTGTVDGSRPVHECLRVHADQDHALYAVGCEGDVAPWTIMGFEPLLRAQLVLDWCRRVRLDGRAEELDALLRFAYQRSGLARGYVAFPSDDHLPERLEILETFWVGRLRDRPVAFFRARFGGLAGTYWTGRFDLAHGHVQQYPEDADFRDALIAAQGHDPRSMLRKEGAPNRLAALMFGAYDPDVVAYV